VVVIRSIISLLVVACAFVQNLYAETKGKAKLLVNAYHQDGDGGDQIYSHDKSQKVTVFEPMLFIDYKIDEKTTVDAHITFDAWTAASDKELDGNTGASGEGIGGQSRTGGRFGIKRDHKEWAWGSSFGVSKEYDYRSLSFGGNLEGRFFDENFVLGISPQLFLDQSKGFDLRAEKTGEFKGRVIGALDISGSQLLSPSDILQFGYTFIHMNGSLNNISNSVIVDTNPYGNSYSRVEERMPHQRVRHAFSTKWVHGFSDEFGMHLSYRYYFDDWDVKSHTAEVGLRLSYNDDDTLIMPTYRYYDQEQASFYDKRFATVQPNMTADSDLGTFTGHRYGINISHVYGDKQIFGIDLLDFGMSYGVYHYTRSNDLDYYLGQFSFFFDF